MSGRPERIAAEPGERRSAPAGGRATAAGWGAGAGPPVLGLQRAVGNRAVAALVGANTVLGLERAVGNRTVAALVGGHMLARAPAGASQVAGAVRRIVLDANVFDQISRGNVEAADVLLEMTRGNDVYISWQAFQEWVVVPRNRAQANMVKRVLERLGIKMAPPAPASVLADLRLKNVYGKGKTILAEGTDLKVAADAKALDAEVFSLDGPFRTNAAVEKTLGVKVAEESKSVAIVRRVKPNQSRALRLLGIKENAVAGALPEGQAAAGAAGGGTVADAPGTSGAVDAAEQAGARTEQTATRAALEIGAEGALRAGTVATVLEVASNPALMVAYELVKGYAGAYQDAWVRIREPARHVGFAQGWVATLVGLDRAWIRDHLAPTFVDRTNVATEVIGAAGMSEEAYVLGLGEGIRYGAQYSLAAASNPISRAYAAIADKGDQVTFDEDGKMQRDSLILVAAVLQPEADRAIARWEALRERRRRAGIDAANAAYANRPDARPL